MAYNPFLYGDLSPFSRAMLASESRLEGVSRGLIGLRPRPFSAGRDRMKTFPNLKEEQMEKKHRKQLGPPGWEREVNYGMGMARRDLMSSSDSEGETYGEEAQKAAGPSRPAGRGGSWSGMARETSVEKEIQAGSSSSSSKGTPSLFPTPTRKSLTDKATQIRTERADALHAVRLAVHRGMDEERILDIMKSYPKESYDIIEKRIQAVMAGKSYEQAGITTTGERKGSSSPRQTSKHAKIKQATSTKTRHTSAATASEISPPGIFDSSAKLVWDNPIIRDCIIENVHRPGGDVLRHKAIARLITVNRATFETVITKLYYDREYMAFENVYSRSSDIYEYMMKRKASQARTLLYSSKIRVLTETCDDNLEELDLARLAVLYPNCKRIVIKIRLEYSSSGVATIRKSVDHRIDSVDLVLFLTRHRSNTKTVAQCKAIGEMRGMPVKTFRAEDPRSSITLADVVSNIMCKKTLEAAFTFSGLVELDLPEVVCCGKPWVELVQCLPKIQKAKFKLGNATTSEDIETLACAWPDLQELFMKSQMGGKWDIGIETVLATLFQHCSRLRSLHCPLNLSKKIEISSEPNIFMPIMSPLYPALCKLGLVLVNSNDIKITGLEINAALMSLVSPACGVSVTSFGKSGSLDFGLAKVLVAEIARGRSSALTFMAASARGKA